MFQFLKGISISRSTIYLSELRLWIEGCVDVDKVEIEWRKMRITYNSIPDKIKKLPIDEMWWEVGKMKDFDENPAFKNLYKLVKLRVTGRPDFTGTVSVFTNCPEKVFRDV